MTKTKTIEIALPQKLKDFKIKHVTYLTRLAGDAESVDGKTFTTLNKCKHLATYSGLDIELIKSANPKDINKAFNHILNVVNTYKPGEVAMSVNVAGEHYDLIDLTKQTGGWLIDFESKRDDFIESPEKLAALCYVERGKSYGDIRASEREAVFLDEFSATDYLNLTGFFLSKLEIFIENSAFLMKTQALKAMKSEIIKAKIKNDLKRIRLLFLRK